MSVWASRSELAAQKIAHGCHSSCFHHATQPTLAAPGLSDEGHSLHRCWRARACACARVRVRVCVGVGQELEIAITQTSQKARQSKITKTTPSVN